MLAPQSLDEQVRAQVLRSTRDAYDDLDFRDYEAQFVRREGVLINLGQVLAHERMVLKALLGELSTCSTGLTLGPFAKGLVDAVPDRRELWQEAVAAFRSADPSNRSTEFLGCYLFNVQKADGDLVEVLLDEVLEDGTLSEWFPLLQLRVNVSNAGIGRLQMSLIRQRAPVEHYRGMPWSEQIGDVALLELMPLVLQLRDGFDVIADSMSMRIQRHQHEHKPLSLELTRVGRMVIEACEFSRERHRELHALEELIEACLASDDSLATVDSTLGRLVTAHSKYEVGFMEQNRILGALLSVQAHHVLDTLFALTSEGEQIGIRDFFDHDHLLGSPLD